MACTESSRILARLQATRAWRSVSRSSTMPSSFGRSPQIGRPTTVVPRQCLGTSCSAFERGASGLFEGGAG